MRLFVVLFFVLGGLVAALPLSRQQQRQQTPPDVVPDAELLPTGPTPSVTPSPIPATVPPTTLAPPAASPGTSPGASPGTLPGTSPTPGASPSQSPTTDGPGLPPVGIPGVPSGDGGDGDGDGFGEETFEPEPTPILVGGDSNRAALAGGLTGGIFALLLLLCCCGWFAVGRKKKKDEDETGTGVYTSTDAGVGSGDAEPSVEPTPAPIPGALDKDVAREQGPADGGTAAGAGLGLLGLGGAAAAGAATTTDESSEEVITRGPTPPLHDYILGAGPAATRKDFVDLQAKFERDEIGDNSAVLGVERTGVVGEGLERDMTTSAAEAGTAGAGVIGSTVLPHETETGPGMEIKPEVLPDRGGPVPMTFDSQERLMAGGDGSGAISDAAMSLSASIAEESGDVPSLERDPILRERERDQTF